MTEHKNVFCALAAAQAEMEPVIKTAVNPAFKSAERREGTTYADLADVVAAARPALNKHGLAFYHFLTRDETARYMVTALVHGPSETRIECPVELLIGKNDMQGYKSATTYAKRIGLESVTGLAPEDDDGNAAAKNPPKAEPRRSAPQRAPEPPHDPQTGEIQSNGNIGHAAAQGLHDAWEAGVLDSLPANANPRQKAEAFANQIIADFDRYKSMNGLRGYCSGKNKYFIRFETTYPDIAAQVQEAFDRAEVRINGDDPIVLGDVQVTDDAGHPL